MAKASSGVVNKIYWRGGGSDVLGESDGTGSFTEEYVFFNGRRIGRRDVAAGGVDYYLSDHLSTASVIATSLGGNKEESDYYPYGGELPISGADSNNYKFTGKERDSESGLDMFGARYYGSSLGRFMTPDWAAKPTNVPYASFGNPQSLNLYSYVNNNPTTTRDPDGHVAGVDDAAEALVFTAAVFTTAVVIYESQPQNQRNFAEATSQAFTNTVDTVKSWFQSSPKQSQSNPWQGKPGETVQTTRPDGTPQQTRRYGPDGYPETDVDHSPHHGQPDPTPTILGVLRMVPLRPLPTVAPEEMYSQAIHSHSNNSNHRRNHSNRCSHSRRHLHHRNKRSLSRKE
jgi:RHS repeat-associated protein